MATTTEDRDEGGGTPERLRSRNPVEFFSQVRQEGRRVTWATRQEVMVSSIMVLIMVVAAAIFFYVVDSLIRVVIGFLLPQA
ncbi:MAG: preprotein translocase subunit SecE [Hyphomonadaceae bacterium]|nr:preprotein translocase subunit SecE [Hyphomonadaceae bacterium]